MTRNEKLTTQLSEQLNTTKQKKIAADKLLLRTEIVIGILSVINVFFCLAVFSFFAAVGFTGAAIAFLVIGFIPFCIGMAYALRIEQLAGYYKCKKCGHYHIPTYKQVMWAMHFGRTRYMKCPECNQKSWQKKALTKD